MRRLPAPHRPPHLLQRVRPPNHRSRRPTLHRRSRRRRRGFSADSWDPADAIDDPAATKRLSVRQVVSLLERVIALAALIFALLWGVSSLGSEPDELAAPDTPRAPRASGQEPEIAPEASIAPRAPSKRETEDDPRPAPSPIEVPADARPSPVTLEPVAPPPAGPVEPTPIVPPPEPIPAEPSPPPAPGAPASEPTPAPAPEPTAPAVEPAPSAPAPTDPGAPPAEPAPEPTPAPAEPTPTDATTEPEPEPEEPSSGGGLIGGLFGP